MAHTVSGLIRRAPHIAAGQNNSGSYTMFCFELSEFNKGYGETEDSYTNYSIALFAKSPAAIDFHNQAIAENAFVVIDCDKLVIDKQSGNDGKEYIKLKMMNARLSGFNNPNGQQQSAAPQQSTQGFAPAAAPQSLGPDRQGKDKVWTHAELLAQGATIEQINKMPIIDDIPF